MRFIRLAGARNVEKMKERNEQINFAQCYNVLYFEL